MGCGSSNIEAAMLHRHGSTVARNEQMSLEAIVSKKFNPLTDVDIKTCHWPGPPHIFTQTHVVFHFKCPIYEFNPPSDTEININHCTI